MSKYRKDAVPTLDRDTKENVNQFKKLRSINRIGLYSLKGGT